MKTVFIFDIISLNFYFCCPICFSFCENIFETKKNLGFWCYQCKELLTCIGAGHFNDYYKILYHDFHFEIKDFYSKCLKRISKVKIYAYFLEKILLKKDSYELKKTFEEFKNILNLCIPNELLMYETNILCLKNNNLKRKRTLEYHLCDYKQQKIKLICSKCFSKYN